MGFRLGLGLARAAMGYGTCPVGDPYLEPYLDPYLESYLGAKPRTVFNLLVGTKGASRRAPNDEPGGDTYRSQSFNSRSGVSQTHGRRSTVLGTRTELYGGLGVAARAARGSRPSARVRAGVANRITFRPYNSYYRRYPCGCPPSPPVMPPVPPRRARAPAIGWRTRGRTNNQEHLKRALSRPIES